MYKTALFLYFQKAKCELWLYRVHRDDSKDLVLKKS